MRLIQYLAAATALCLSPAIHAQDDADPAPYERGFFVSPMATFFSPDSDRDLDTGAGATIGFGYRFGGIALELAPHFIDVDQEMGAGGSSAEFSGGTIDALLFFGDEQPRWFGIFGLGYTEVDGQANLGGGSFDGETVDLGFGYIYPMSFGRYDFGLRAEVRARQVDTDVESAPLGTQSSYVDALANVGLFLPIGNRPTPPPPPPPPVVAVVEPAAMCSDGIDNDNDGLIDYPNDKGCDSASDNDEQTYMCSDGIDNDGDGEVDLNDVGCDGPTDNDETNPCREPVAGEALDLSGCGTGDVLVLRGVNFEFDRSALTANAKTILDGVARALEQHPRIKVELAGHTDALGGEKYNQRLSEQRAKSVSAYLRDKGIAAERMVAVGFGEAEPVASNETDAGREENRRVELRITEGVARKPS